MKPPKKLIEVALPLKAINEACAREKSIRHGHPSTLHLWWARRPLAAARAVIFAQMVDDPLEKYGENPTPQQRSAATKERRRLFALIEELVKWENTNNEEVLERARAEIRKSCPEGLPAFHDPFAGGGALPLEAQRLGLESYASDLNPVAVMINKAMIEIPPKFAGRKPIGPVPAGEELPDAFKEWPGATGLAEDVRRYGYWMREEAKKRIGHLYPQVEITKEMAAKRPDLKQYVGQKLTVIAWLWARTVKSPNPMYSHVDVPLVSSYLICDTSSRRVYLKPVVIKDSYHFDVCTGTPPEDLAMGLKQAGSNFSCVLSSAPIEGDYIKSEGKAGRVGNKLLAIVCESNDGRIYLPANEEHEKIAFSLKPRWRPESSFNPDALGFRVGNYGMLKWADLFTDRQTIVLDTFSILLSELKVKIVGDAKEKSWAEDGIPLVQGGAQANAYADALSVYLAFAIDKVADYCNSLCDWHVSREQIGHLFSRQAIPMKWDYCETNPFSSSSGNYMNMVEWIVKAIINLPCCGKIGSVHQADAQTQNISLNKLISTDPPYYDNIGYADLADFFYVWMRRGLKDIYPKVFSTMATPKDEELVATPCRHGGKQRAAEFFLDGMTATMSNLCRLANESFPVTIYYAFKQSESNVEGTSNTGWETFIEALVRAGFMITGTWPMRTELGNRMRGIASNALASSVVLVCRKRAEDATEITRRQFLRELMEKMPGALEDMQGGDENTAPVAPVDMAQAIIGPGMEIYSKYKAVLNADGSRMSVHDAIIEINRFLDEGDDFDAETQFCRDWFREHQWGEGPSGEADVLARAKGLSVDYVVDAGVLFSKGGKTSLVKWQDYPDDYDPTEDAHRPVWEVCHHLVRIHQRRGTGAAGEFLSMVQGQGEAARQLAYLLYTLCERKGLAEDARVYNELATAWNDIVTSSIENAKPVLKQAVLDL